MADAQPPVGNPGEDPVDVVMEDVGGAPANDGMDEDPTVPDPFEVREAVGMGLGCFATRDISAGERVLVEKCRLTCFSYSNRHDIMEDLIENYKKLGNEEREQCLSLHASEDWEVSKRVWRVLNKFDMSIEEKEEYARLYLVFEANAFSLEEADKLDDGTVISAGIDGIFLKASRFNHSCDPNLSYTTTVVPGFWIATATRPIRKGTQLTVTYIPPFPSRDRRQATLQSWGFTCRCIRCEGWDDDYDKELLEACRLQGLVPEEAEGIPQEANEDPGHARLRRRIELTRKLRWPHALVFAYHDLGAYLMYQADELLEEDANRALELLEESRIIIGNAVVLGTRHFGSNDSIVAEIQSELVLANRRIQRIHDEEGIA
ncbi:SET domain-containing protein [Hypoxylon sp. NC0597]|nr:SET domain-containing protein [Hypoxylon sp. NC0597]